MEWGVILLGIAIVIVSIWVFSRLKILKHKFLLILIIGVILFAFVSFTSAFNEKDLSIKSISDVGNLAKIYFSWFGNAFANFKTLTAQAVDMNWQGNKTS